MTTPSVKRSTPSPSTVSRYTTSGRKQGQPSGIVLFASAQGYAGTIKLLLGISAQGDLTGVRVIEHKETRAR